MVRLWTLAGADRAYAGPPWQLSKVSLMVSHGYATSCGFGCDPVYLGGCVVGDGRDVRVRGRRHRCVCVCVCACVRVWVGMWNEGHRDARHRCNWRASGSSPTKTWRLRGITRRPSRGSLPRKCSRQTGDHIVQNTTQCARATGSLVTKRTHLQRLRRVTSALRTLYRRARRRWRASRRRTRRRRPGRGRGGA